MGDFVYVEIDKLKNLNESFYLASAYLNSEFIRFQAWNNDIRMVDSQFSKPLVKNFTDGMTIINIKSTKAIVVGMVFHRLCRENKFINRGIAII